MPRRSATAVAETRAAVTRSAMERASIEGLEGLTLGGLADDVEMRKSSVFSLYGSKEELQRAALDAAVDHFVAEVWAPVADLPAGRDRLLALCERWLDYHRREAMPGGCFLTTATVEFDARPGPLRDRVQAIMRRWLGLLERDAAAAIETGELSPGPDAGDIAFELNALAAAASYGWQLNRDPEVFERAGRSMRRALAG